ncbi:MAG: response regulator transcription factor [Campylobacteraceae bacterium]|nr:response regulator transcription factor [Campylobacteraceae bacterium]
MKILLLEDDEILNEIIESFLLEKGHQISCVYDGDEAEDLLTQEIFDLLLLDVNVPSVNGFELLKRVRKNSIFTPAIFITSLNDTEDLKNGFSSGCDDYIKKPFEFEELELRIDNIKRLYGIEQAKIEIISKSITYDYDRLKIIKNGEQYTISKKESKILEYFLRNRDKTISLEELGSNIWAYEEVPTDSTIRTYIKNLRKILTKECITTTKGVGYRFNKG